MSTRDTFYFIAGLLFTPAGLYASCLFVKYGQDIANWLLRRPCPRCGGNGYIEEADLDSRSVSQWPCSCKEGRKFQRRIREEYEKYHD